MASSLKYAYPFSRLDEFKREKYDAWVSGLECPLVEGVHMTAAEQEANLQFNCRPEFTAEAAKWFTVFTLANNHTDNQGGQKGLDETRRHLEKHGIQHFGHYDPKVTRDVCEVIALPVRVKKTDATKEKGALPVAMCGYHGVFQIPPEESVRQISRYSAYMPVIAMPHMGAEYVAAPDQIKTDFYRSLIDAGADVVIGDHPHWVQTTESYKGRLIVYSLGNFMFDQQGSKELTRSAVIRMKLKVEDEGELMASWLALGETCRAFRDECLAQAKQQGLQKLGASYGFAAMGATDSDKITKPATAAETSEIVDRLNWSQTMRQLHTPYSAL